MGFFNWQTLRPRKMSMAGMNCRFVRNQAGRPERDYEAHQLCPVNYGLLKVGGWWWFLGCQNFCIWQFWKWSLQKVDDWMTWSNSSSPHPPWIFQASKSFPRNRPLPSAACPSWPLRRRWHWHRWLEWDWCTRWYTKRGLEVVVFWISIIFMYVLCIYIYTVYVHEFLYIHY